jgi:hypothetical protein
MQPKLISFRARRNPDVIFCLHKLSWFCCKRTCNLSISNNLTLFESGTTLAALLCKQFTLKRIYITIFSTRPFGLALRRSNVVAVFNSRLRNTEAETK